MLSPLCSKTRTYYSPCSPISPSSGSSSKAIVTNVVQLNTIWLLAIAEPGAQQKFSAGSAYLYRVRKSSATERKLRSAQNRRSAAGAGTAGCISFYANDTGHGNQL